MALGARFYLQSDVVGPARLSAVLNHLRRMYHMDHLLTLLTIEKTKELRFRAGRPPIIVSEAEQHSLQGPPVTAEDVMRLLRSVATSRQMRDLRECGSVHFIYTTRGRSPFVVRAKMEDENVVFDVS